jgi:Flp pilus assembly pilin Flp
MSSALSEIILNIGVRMKTAKRFLQCESAATATEYAILLAAIGGLLLVSLTAFGNESGTFWGRTADMMQAITR